jgi:hypothetical protein
MTRHKTQLHTSQIALIAVCGFGTAFQILNALIKYWKIIFQKVRAVDMSVYIGEASKDENGNLWGGKDGDQNGLEVRVIGWFPQTGDGRRWDWIARIRNRPDVARAIATLMIESCNNQNVGYNQHRRETFTNECRKVGWKPKDVKVPCATDCSALVACVLNCLNIQVSTGMNTDSELGALKNTGLFDILYDSKYLTTPDNLQIGDILHMPGHTAIVVQNSESTQPVPEQNKENEQVGARMWINWQFFESGKEYTDSSGWYINGDGGQAYGRYQFDYEYGLVPFMQFCVQQYPTLFNGFQPYIDLGVKNPALIGNEGLKQLFVEYTNNHLTEFSKMQNWAMFNDYYQLIRTNIQKHLGYDISNIGAYAVGTAASIAIRDSGHWDAVQDIFFGTTGKETESDWIKLVMARQNAKTGYYDGDRWTNTQYNRVFADMQAQTGVIQIGEGTISDSDSKAPVNPAGGNAGSATGSGTTEVIEPTPPPPPVGGIDARNTFCPFWSLKYFANVLPFKTDN